MYDQARLDCCGLHHFALIGDDEGVCRALRDGADVNAVDAPGRTAIMCAVSGNKYAFFSLIDFRFNELFQLA